MISERESERKMFTYCKCFGYLFFLPFYILQLTNQKSNLVNIYYLFLYFAIDKPQIYVNYFRNLPEVKSTHKFLGVPTVSARFGTSPFLWNWGMEAFTNILPVVCILLSKPFLNFMRALLLLFPLVF